jgi:hypothetical protein
MALWTFNRVDQTATSSRLPKSIAASRLFSAATMRGRETNVAQPRAFSSEVDAGSRQENA